MYCIYTFMVLDRNSNQNFYRVFNMYVNTYNMDNSYTIYT